MGRARRILVIAGLAATVGCTAYHPNTTSRAALPLPAEVSQYYSYRPNDTPPTVRIIEKQRSYTVKDVTLTGAPLSSPIEFTWYAPVSHELRPLILIAPIRGSDTFIVDGLARDFAQRGYHAAIVKRLRFRFDTAKPIDQVEDTLRASVIRHRQALDWLLAQPTVDATRIGTFGISYGAIVNAALAAVEPRVRVHVIDLAGGPLAGVMKTSEEHSIRRDWDRGRQSLDLSNSQFYQALFDVVRTDPVKLAPYVAAESVLMLIARFDHSVPTPFQLQLWEALGKPRADFVFGGHYTSILALPAHRGTIMKFFQQNFQAPAPARPPKIPSVLAVQAK
jgi:hypothetical protein